MIDSLPLGFFLIVAPVLWSWLIVSTVRRARPDPDPQWSRLDCLDGLDSRID